ncbi:two component sensor kinase for C4-dicarboxylate transport [Bordetella ansorpii]|uniref:C4-dicarboxylate transport sensor protein DctB n=1 Tax=Bordetella ansorpii TaxID=288768 RepID=A0A157QCP9_9BORD|nr:ATP-binding protein [Bordetella ansorpii]SAI43517.1 two component sensor kinase for C4-dicarboxylate transport [Bordetella ansorpii]
MSKNFPSPPADPVSRDAHAAAPLSTAPPEHATPRRMRAALLLLAVLALAAWLVHRAGVWGADRAVQELATHARAAAQLNTVALRSSLDKFRSVPFVLAQDPEVRATLLAPEPERILQLDHKLTALSRGVGASAIYLLDMTGLAIAASNWNEPATFVGVDYQFRPYFRRAVSEGEAEYFALGTISHEPGLYLSRRIANSAGKLLGVIVLKMDFTILERNWEALEDALFITDGNGVVLMGNVPDWRFRATGALPEATARAMRADQQFGDARFEPLPVTLPSGSQDAGTLVRARAALRRQPAGARLLHTAFPVVSSDRWTLHTLSPVQPAIDRAAANAQLATLLALTACGLSAGLYIYLRTRARRRTHAQAVVRAELEHQVQQRTGELRRANTELQALIDERQHAEARLHQMQDELVQANKLALLGQVAAGVAHEINQPAAAIRAYADNTAEFARRGQDAAVLENLQTIAALTERIGGITGELRAFSRKAAASVAPIPLDDALEGALLLVGPRITRQRVLVTHPGRQPQLKVLADRMRLEQVFVNLLQNAMDALQDSGDPRIDILIDVHGQTGEPPRASNGLAAQRRAGATDQVLIHIRDNGPGLAPELREKLFTPFQTTKPEGLGLGLIICRDILTEFGGGLHAADATPHGAIFTVTLAAAPAGEPA